MSEHWSLRYLRAVLAETGLTASALASKAGMSSTTLTRPMNDPTHSFDLSRRTLERIEAATGIAFAPFATGSEDAVILAAPLTTPSAAMIDVFDVRASAGNGSLIDQEEIVDRLSFPPDYLKRLTKTAPRHLAIIGVKGDSMEPTLKDDDLVMLDTTKTSLDFDGLFVLRWGDALHVKRVGRATNGSVRIISDNSAIYPPIEMPRSEVQVVGKVIWLGKKV